MAVDDDRPIDDAVVEIKPSFAGFRAALREGLERSSRNISVSVPMKLDTRGFRNALVTYVRSIDVKVRVGVELDRNQLANALKTATAGSNAKVDIDADVDESKIVNKLKRIDGTVLRYAANTNRALSSRLEREFAFLGRESSKLSDVTKRTLDRQQVVEKSHTGWLFREYEKRRNAAARAAARASGGGGGGGGGRRTLLGGGGGGLWRQLEQAGERGRLLNWGGRGIRPLNLLRGAVVALSPALIAMAADAGMASAGLASLGSVAIGTAGLITSVSLAFGSVSDYMKQLILEQKAQRQETAANIEENQDLAASAREILLAEYALHDARVQARRDLEDLIERQSDLARQTRRDTLDVAEAKEKRDATVRNFFASKLERAQAQADYIDALDQRSDTRRELRRTREDLALFRKRGGPAGQPAVLSAQESLDDLRNPQARSKASRNRRSAAETQLAYLRSQMSASALALADFLDAQQPEFKRLRRMQEDAVLPGFLSFMRAIMAKPRGGKSTLEIMAAGAARLGGILGGLVADLGEMMRTGWFRGGLRKINDANAESFQNIADAVKSLFRPLWRILVNSAPLMQRFTGYLLELAGSFTTWTNSFSDGEMRRFFTDTGSQIKKIWQPVEDLFITLWNVFKAAAPSGDTLWARLGELTSWLRNWSASAEGQRQVTRFFEFFARFDYAKLARTAADLVTITSIFKAGKYVANHPLLSLFAALAASYPAGTAAFLDTVADALSKIMRYAVDHPGDVAAITSLILAYKGLNAIGNFKFPSFPGLPKWLGGGGGSMTVATMHVTAATVILGGGAATKAATAATTPAALAAGGMGTLVAGLAAAVIAAGVFTYTGLKGSGENKTPFGLTEDFLKDPSLSGLPKGLIGLSPIGVLANQIDLWRQHGFSAMLAMDAGQAKSLAEAIYNAFHGRTKPRRPGGGPFGGAPGTPLRDYLQQASASSMAKEQSAFANVWEWRHQEGPARKEALNDYITTRKKAVLDYVSYIRSTQGPVAAEKALREENAKSAATVRTLASEMGLGKKKTQEYTDKIKAVPKVSKTKTETPGLKDAQSGFSILKTRIDPVTGEKVITVSVNGAETVFPTLQEALIYQRALQSGLSLTAAKQALQKDKDLDRWARRLQQQNTVKKAAGGPIHGPGGPTGDRIPAMLSDGEYVLRAQAVKKIGVDRLNYLNTAHFARGGPVGNWSFPVDMSKTMIPISPLIAGGEISGDLNVARIAEDTARKLHATEKQLIALFEAGLVESGMRNLNYGDRDSVGFLQQRPSMGWGTVKQITDPAYATRKFIRAAKLRDSTKYSAGQLAQAVQRSAYPDRYDQRYADAVALLNLTPPYVAGGLGGGGSSAGLVGFGRWLQARGYDVSEHPLFGGVHGVHVKNSQHYRGTAIDVNHGAGTSAREQKYLRMIIPEARRRGFRTIFMDPKLGHYDHAHIDLGRGRKRGGPVNVARYDAGGGLKPGVTLAYNGTGSTETVRTREQERSLWSRRDQNTGTMRLDRRDLALLAQYIIAASNSVVQIDGREVARAANRYTSLPGGF